MKQQLIITQGIPASGKSTWAQQFANEYPELVVVVSKDGIRNMLGKYWVQEREPLVKQMSREMVSIALENGYTVIIDDTNLHISHVPYWEAKADAYGVKLVIKRFDIGLHEAISRNISRGLKVSTEIVTNFFNELYINEDSPYYSPMHCTKCTAITKYDMDLGTFKCTECDNTDNTF